MKTKVTALHCQVADELRTRAETVAERFEHLSPHALETTVVFDVEAGEPTAEIRLHVRGGQILVAHGVDKDHRTALDRAEEKLRKQLERAATQALRSRRLADETT